MHALLYSQILAASLVIRGTNAALIQRAEGQPVKFDYFGLKTDGAGHKELNGNYLTVVAPDRRHNFKASDGQPLLFINLGKQNTTDSTIDKSFYLVDHKLYYDPSKNPAWSGKSKKPIALAFNTTLPKNAPYDGPASLAMFVDPKEAPEKEFKYAEKVEFANPAHINHFVIGQIGKWGGKGQMDDWYVCDQKGLFGVPTKAKDAKKRDVSVKALKWRSLDGNAANEKGDKDCKRVYLYRANK